ncbi:DUF1398 family protein [Chryseobacterium sp.]|uniref:DUF1398 domain-containing protein n=1 Tax=Chryseobacterium sp. TaxID=1871047 RepID=UPI0025C689E5|nr:DUF1398 family protein [Chryseobacterium sp.]
MRFTIDEIQEEHRKVKSGVDFPKYIKAIKEKGVVDYIVYVSDGRAVYFDQDGQNVSTGSKYETLTIAAELNLNEFVSRLKLHQQGGTDYLTFCNDCARNGVEGWKIDLEKMTCSYFDKAENEILVELIPTV